MGLTVDQIARIVVEAEPPTCPACGAKDSFKTAMASVVPAPRGLEDLGEALIITYFCDECETGIHTFA